MFAKAKRQHTRNHNSSLVLRTIYDSNEISRADLARRTKLTRTTVSDVVAQLIERGLVAEVGRGASSGGRTPVLLSVLEDSRHLIGVNLRSGDISGAAINLRGTIRRRTVRSIETRAVEHVLPLILDLIDELVSAATSPLLGIGISTPGLIDARRGIVLSAVNFGWHDLPLRDLLASRYQLPVYLGNDAHMAALAAYTFGSGERRDDLVVIRAGQGIGAGIILNGRLFYGDGYGAGEIGHVVVVENGARCKCGNYGCLETVASSERVIEQAQGLAADPQSHLHAEPVLDLAAVARACTAGDPGVQALVARVGRAIGIALAGMVAGLNIQRIVISGPLAVLGSSLHNAIVQEMGARSLPVLAQQTRVRVVEEAPDAVLLGISALLLRYELVLQHHLALG